MRLSSRHSWQLRRIERRLGRSAPDLAAMLAIFARLSAGEAPTGREQLPVSVSRVRMLITVLAGAVTALAAAVIWVLRRTWSLCAATCRHGRRARTPLNPAPATRGATRPGRRLEQ